MSLDSLLGKASTKKKVKLGLSAEVGGGASGGGPRAQPVIRLLKSKPLTALKDEKK